MNLQTLLETALANDHPIAQAAVLAGATIGAKLLVERDGTTHGTLGDPRLDATVRAEVLVRMVEAKGDTAESVNFPAHDARVYIELYLPPPHLIIFGGVHVAIPLTQYAKMLGFRITLADPRTTFANKERFPDVDRIIPEWPEDAMPYLTINASTYIAILTHDPKLDEPALQGVLGKGAAYVGAIGSRKTHAERFDRMAKHGVSPDQLGEVYAPIGLDLNANNPEELALSIMAEIIAVRRGGKGGYLREKGERREERESR
jgi:xanthine dehydrogenase accessory factor